MKVKVITIATYDGLGLAMLKKSMYDNNIDYVVLGQGESWKGYGMKIIETVNYLKHLSAEYTHFMFVDAYDTYFLDNMKKVEEVYRNNWNDKIVFSTEKACWPNPEKSILYPLCTSPWQYLNSGGYMAPVATFLHFISHYKPVEYTDDDQAYYTDLFLSGGIELDSECRMWQSIAFEADGDFSYNGKLKNNFTSSEPIIIHGNGRTLMDKIYKL